MTLALKVNAEYDAILPRLSKEEYEALKLSIKEEGQHFPIVYNEEREILDGHHRYRVCQELGIDPKFEKKVFSNKLLEKKFVIEANLRRRQLTDFVRGEFGLFLMEIETERAKQRQEATQFGSSGPVQMNLTEEAKGQARDIVARQIGLSPTTFQRVLTIIEKGSEDLKKKCRKGQTSIAYGYQMIQRSHCETPPLPKGTFDVVLADPPWQYALRLRGSADMHYPTMTMEEISKLEIPSAEDAILFLWATNPKLEDALAVMKAWGFTYKTNMVWVKDKFGTGYYFRGQHELLLVGIKGKFSPPPEEKRVSSVLSAPTRKYSRKPNAVYTRIESMYSGHSFLELFATEACENWEVWGHDV